MRRYAHRGLCRPALHMHQHVCQHEHAHEVRCATMHATMQASFKTASGDVAPGYDLLVGADGAGSAVRSELQVG